MLLAVHAADRLAFILTFILKLAPPQATLGRNNHITSRQYNSKILTVYIMQRYDIHYTGTCTVFRFSVMFYVVMSVVAYELQISVGAARDTCMLAVMLVVQNQKHIFCTFWSIKILCSSFVWAFSTQSAFSVQSMRVCLLACCCYCFVQACLLW